MISVTHRVESGGANEDRLLVERHGKRTVAIICDGAGNGGRGGMAADLAIAELSRIAQAGFTDWMRALLAVDQLLKRQAQGGETTCVVVDISDSGECRGASVGDSGAWMLPAGSAVRDLNSCSDACRVPSRAFENRAAQTMRHQLSKYFLCFSENECRPRNFCRIDLSGRGSPFLGCP